MIRASAVDGVRGEHNSFNNGIYSASLGSRLMGKDGRKAGGVGWVLLLLPSARYCIVCSK